MSPRRSLKVLRRVVQTDLIGSKLRVLPVDTSYVDVWGSRKSAGRFGFRWERHHSDGRMYRYDNFPDTLWSDVPTFPFHFHDGDQDSVVAAPFAPSSEQGFREFMVFAQRMMTTEAGLKAVTARFELGERSEFVHRDPYHLGYGLTQPIALEGALKLKEITYAHCEGIFSSEFKHGPLSAVHDGYPVVFVTAPGDEMMMINHVNENTAHGGRAIAPAEEHPASKAHRLPYERRPWHRPGLSAKSEQDVDRGPSRVNP